MLGQNQGQGVINSYHDNSGYKVKSDGTVISHETPLETVDTSSSLPVSSVPFTASKGRGKLHAAGRWLLLA
jgi:hypothetical protein